MTRFLRFLAAVVFLAGFTSASQAQNAATSELHVTVRDPKGAVVTNATVAARDESKALERSTTANSDGEYHLIALPPGTYTVSVEAAGFAKAEVKDVTVTVGQSAELPVALVISASQTSITVTSEAALVETARTSSTETVDQRSIDNLPINGRNYIDFTKTNSQVVKDNAPSIGAAPTSGLNFGGQRARANLVNVDGADAVDNSTNGVRSTVSQEAVKEFQIITNGYAAEYGRASGGVVNIVTRSGSNDLHGSVFGYLRNRKFQAVNPFSNVKDPAFTRVQAGFTLGGAIKKDKTFYYFAYETTRRHETGFSSIGADNYGLTPFDATPFFNPLAPAGTFGVQVTPQQAGFLSAVEPLFPGLPTPLQQGIQKYVFLAGGSSGIAINGAYPGAFAFVTPPVPNQLQQFPTSCNSTNLTCNGLPTSFLSLASQTGNFPVAENTSVYSLRLDHNVNANNQVMLRANVSPSSVNGIEVNGQNQTFGQNAYSRTSEQTFHDAGGVAKETWVIGNNRVNEALFQYSRRGLGFNFSQGPGGGSLAANIAGFAFVGREPFSYIQRTEQRYQFVDNFSWSVKSHDLKFGVDYNYLPLSATFTVNYGGVINFGGLDAASLGFPDLTSTFGTTFPGFSPVQAYGLGLPSTFIQGIGNPHDSFSNKPLGLYVQDSWKIRRNITLNYGLRYDVEFGPKFAEPSGLAGAAYKALGIQKGIQNDTNNFAPRIGLAWDPGNDGKTVIRSSYGLFYDHPLLGLYFLGDASDGSKSGQLLFFGGSPCDGSAPGSPFNLNATNIFQGTLGLSNCFPAAGPALGYQPNQQRFDAFDPNSLFINQGYLGAGLPLISQPFGFPQASNFVFGYSNQANLTVERDLGKGFALSVAYNFNGGRHLNRPINANAVHGNALVANWRAAQADPLSGATPTSSPLFVGSSVPCDPANPTWVSAALVSFFRPGGVNPSIANALIPQGGGGCVTLANAILAHSGSGFNSTCDPFANSGSLTGCIPFSDQAANYSNGSSVYHGLSVNLRKRFTSHYQLLASYTWSHAIDDSTDLQSPLSPQDTYVPSAERSTSTFDQRHRFVLSGNYYTGRVGSGGARSALFSDWTFSTIIDVASGRPFNIITGQDTTFQFAPSEARPNVVPAGTAKTSCGDAAVASKFSPTGFLQVPCFIDGNLAGNLSRNAGHRPWTLFNDLRVARTFPLGERFQLEGIMDLFNIANKYNVADVNPLYTSAGQATAASEPRQFQFALRLKW